MSTRGSGVPHGIPPTYQTLATLAQANPVSGNEYTVLATTANVRIITIMGYTEWTVQPTPLEIRLYIDGQTLVFTFANPATATVYNTVLQAHSVDASHAMSTGGVSSDLYKAFLMEGKSVRVTAEITGGTVQNLTCYVRYAKW